MRGCAVGHAIGGAHGGEEGQGDAIRFSQAAFESWIGGDRASGFDRVSALNFGDFDDAGAVGGADDI